MLVRCGFSQKNIPVIPLHDINFIVTDVETTGTSGENNRVTEIGCVVVRGGEVQHTFTSLVNPRQFIPPFIEQMTGITNAMVFNAPEERDVFAEVYKLLKLPNAVFVGHNEQFDWSFVSNSLKRSGLPVPQIDRICTCKLARRLLPKTRKKNLGAVAEYFGIHIDGRHRAYGDAEATARVLIEFLEHLEEHHEVQTMGDVLSFQNKRLSNFHPTPRVLKRVQEYLDELPEAPGVYYMYDDDGFLMYVGKAKTLSERVRSYFQMSAQHPKKIADMVKNVHEIKWVETGTELAALLLESKEIKKHKPPFNTMSKKLRWYPFLKLTNEDFPRLELCSGIEQDGADYYGPFPRRGMVEEILTTVKKNFTLRLCNEPIEPQPSFRPCFYYHIKQCNAPCAAKQTQQEYKQDVDAVKTFLSGYSHGIIATLEHEMHECAERLEFETAAMLRNRLRDLRQLFDRSQDVSSAVNNTNFILVLPTENDDKTVEVFIVRLGLLAYQAVIGRKASLRELEKKITALFYSGTELSMPLTREQVDELRIITQWTYRKRHRGVQIYIENLSVSDVLTKATDAIRNVQHTPDVVTIEEIDVLDSE